MIKLTSVIFETHVNNNWQLSHRVSDDTGVIQDNASGSSSPSPPLFDYDDDSFLSFFFRMMMIFRMMTILCLLLLPLSERDNEVMGPVWMR
jgi:hypothetical protein